MAFNFLGTLSRPQLEDLKGFLIEQMDDIEEEINYLYAEVNNLEETLANLVFADNNFAGNALMRVYDTELPDVVKVPHQDDTNSALIMERIKKPFISTIKYKRERLEYKIKKMTDAIEQSKEMIDRKAIAKSQTLSLISEVETLFTAKNANHLFNTTEDMKNYQRGIFVSTPQVTAV